MGNTKVKKEESEVKKALFLQRFLAFIIDMFLISFIASLITTPFIDTDKTAKLEKESVELMEHLQDENVDYQEYVDQYISVYYKLTRATGIDTIVSILFSVLYFVVYQVLAKGQTFGKKLMKIRVVSKEGDLSFNQMIFRSFLSNFILVNLLSFIFMLFASKRVYFYVSGCFLMIQYAIVLISAVMIMNRKNGEAIHDKIAHTMVIREK